MFTNDCESFSRALCGKITLLIPSLFLHDSLGRSEMEAAPPPSRRDMRVYAIYMIDVFLFMRGSFVDSIPKEIRNSIRVEILRGVFRGCCDERTGMVRSSEFKRLSLLKGLAPLLIINPFLT